jgi:hypothetical protein
MGEVSIPLAAVICIGTQLDLNAVAGERQQGPSRRGESSLHPVHAVYEQDQDEDKGDFQPVL